MNTVKPIIEIKGIGKEYNITHQKGGYVTLRDILTNVAKRPFAFLKHKAKQVAGFETKEAFWALRDVSFDVMPGEIIGIIGANGAGKSTLLKILTGITPPTEGEIIMRGRVASLLEVGTGFHPELTGRENIFLNGAILGMTKKEIARKFDEIVAFSGVEKFLDTPVKYYSSGMYVRLAFSVAAHMEPDILLVDEVLAVGDAEFQKKCLGKMEEVTKKDGRTILFVSHNLNAIQTLCDKCAILEKGKLVFLGNTREAVSRYLNKENPLQQSGEIVPSQHIKGTKESVIRRVTVGNDHVEHKGEFAINEPLTLRINYSTAKAERKISFWLQFINQNGEVIINSFQKDSGMITDPMIGEHALKVTFGRMGLLPGKYTISAGIFSHNSLNDFIFADWVESVQSFEISKTFADGKPFDGRIGMVSEDAAWHVTE